MPGNVLEVSDDTFQAEVLNATGPVLVDFWAPGCAPCRALAPVIEQIADEHSPRIKFVKIDATANTRVSEDYSIRKVPALMFFHHGRPVDTCHGVTARELIVRKIDAMSTGPERR